MARTIQIEEFSRWEIEFLEKFKNCSSVEELRRLVKQYLLEAFSRKEAREVYLWLLEQW